MLFNSYLFLFFFLPLTLIVFYFFQSWFSSKIVIAYLFLASLLFYAYWNTVFLSLLVLSIVFNYLISLLIEKNKKFLYLGIVINLAVLVYFKYSQFLLSNFFSLFNYPFKIRDIDLPLGISFFTFTQIAFLIDRYKQEVPKTNFISYGLFVTFFPHLMAGPILSHKEIIPQFKNIKATLFTWNNLSVGLVVFSIGLFKKSILADSLSPFTSKFFFAAENGPMYFLDAWYGSLAYTFQLYFDFSGYSDMAIGLARIFGINFPLNFNSPYKSTNIIDFWRRWHMTLSCFLRDYIYIPLGGNRKGKFRRYINLVLTMLIGGIWHGASWTFVIWGSLHGLYLVCNHSWIYFHERFISSKFKNNLATTFLARFLTFITIAVGWVFFRAETFAASSNMIKGMFHFKNISGTFANKVILANEFGYLTVLLLVSAFIVFFVPNSQQLLEQFKPTYNEFNKKDFQLNFLNNFWRPNLGLACYCAFLTVLSLLTFGQVTEFLYYKF